MEKLPIEIWDQLVCNTFYPTKLKNSLLDNGAVDTFVEESKKGRELVRSYLIKESFLRKTGQEIKILIEQHQFFFSGLLDTVFEYQSNNDIPFEMLKVYEQVTNDLEAIMRLLENWFCGYFNQNANVPNPIRIRFEKSIKPHLSRIKKLLAEHEKNHQFIESIFSLIENCIQPSATAMNYRQLNYFNNLVNLLLKWNAESFSDSKFSPLVEMLIALKFNDESFLLLILKVIKDKLSSVESKEEQINLLKEFYKHTSQIMECSYEPFCVENPSAKELILDWLSQEIHYLETSYSKKEGKFSSSAKINTSLSVPVLALFTRVFKDAGIFTNTNHQELLRFVSTHYTTQRKESISQGHLHSKYYQVDETTKRKVSDLLLEMVKLIKKIQ
jgi:hypothetical protein